MTRPKALDLFCGAGGASRGLYDAGFDVTGVDIAPQPNYPFTFIQADALSIHFFRGFDFVWASPPCQAYTRAQRLRKRAHPDLIAPIREKLRAAGVHYAIENVEGAPLEKPVMLCGAMYGLKTYRHRFFECNFPIHLRTHPKHLAKSAKMGRKPKTDEFIQVVGNFSGAEIARKAMGINWMTRDELREAIPPIYAWWIAIQVPQHRIGLTERLILKEQP